jgi:large subunit ribosomal protein L4
MPTVGVFNKEGNKVADLELNESVFATEVNEYALHQVVVALLANKRQGTQSTKTRSEVRGGGIKPWRQKGTGRARQGSIRRPIWVHGGVAHGPKPKDWRLQVSKSVREVAMKSILSQKMTEKKITILDKIKLEKPSTKDFVKTLEKLKIAGKTILVWTKKDENILRSLRNIKGFYLVNAGTLGAFDVIKTDNVIFIKDAILKINERYNHETK